MLIAAAGLAGVGKTTGLRYLARAGFGAYEYVGGFVQAEVLARGLSVTPENERAIRSELRAERGMAALAELALPELRRKGATRTVLVDAICNCEERDLYRRVLGGDLIIIGLEAPASLRAERLARRRDRPMTSKQLLERDRYELDELRLGDVIATANIILRNVGSKSEFKADLLRQSREWRV